MRVNIKQTARVANAFPLPSLFSILEKKKRKQKGEFSKNKYSLSSTPFLERRTLVESRD